MQLRHQSGLETLGGRSIAPAVALAALGVWAIVVPYLGPELSLRLDVSSQLEFVDHVVPGTVAVLSAVLLFSVLRRGGDASSGWWLVAAGAAFLAGVWMVSTHVPLLEDASRGAADWGPTILHNSSGLPIGLLSLWLLFVALRRGPGAPRP